MNIKLGWSGDIGGAWTKMDVEVDEVDLALHFAEKDQNVADLTFTIIEKFRLMNLLAEIFVHLHKANKFPDFFSKDSDKEVLMGLVKERNQLTQQIIERGNDKPPF